MREQWLVLLKYGQDLGEVEGWRPIGRAEARRDLARVLDKRPRRLPGVAVSLGPFQQQIGHVGIDRIEHGIEHQIKHPLDRERGRDGLADLVDGQGVLEAQVLVLQALAVEPALNRVHHLFDAEGLEHVVVGPVLHRFDGGLHRAESGHDHGENRNAQLGDLFDQLEAVHVGHLQI